MDSVVERYSRRTFIGSIAGALAAQGCSRAATGGSKLSKVARAQARAAKAAGIRRNAIAPGIAGSVPLDSVNGDEERYSNYCASFSKGLPHDDAGDVEPSAYRALLKAIESGSSVDFAEIPLGGDLKLSNPQAAYTFTLQGADSHRLGIPPPPAFASAEAAADLVEVYWHAILRDVPVNRLADSELGAEAAADMARLSAYRGPKSAGNLTPAVLFRGNTPGDLRGPYVSQFLYARVMQGVYTLDQAFRMPAPGVDFITDNAEWLALQRGALAFTDPVLENERRYIRTGRDLARFVHRDYTFQAFLNAALVLLSFGDRYLMPTPYYPRGCAFNSGEFLSKEEGFCTFGPPHILDAVTAVANLALFASWRQKWLLHRRLRPEEFAQRVDRVAHRNGKDRVSDELMKSSVLKYLPSNNFLLPLAYPEGAPCHPSYPAGHAAIAGACATILKAFFRDEAAFPAPAQPSDDGLHLVPFDGERLSIGGELNKLASNISIARNFAGIHYRSDALAGLSLGEAVALSYLADTRRCFTEEFDGFVVSKLDGDVVSV